MEETLYLLGGAVIGACIGAAFAAARWLPVIQRLQVKVSRSPPVVAPASPPIAAILPSARPALEPRAMAGALAEQLSSIASGVDGHAHLLLEAVPSPEQMARAASALWDALAGLRLFHSKLRAFAATPTLAEIVVVPIEPVLEQLRRELGRRELGLTFAYHLPRSLPPVRGDSGALLDALLLLCGALLQLERGARRITVDAETRFEGHEPELVLEIRAEWDEDPSRKPAEPLSQASLELDYGAARNLLAAMGASMEVLRTRGHAARALVHLRPAPMPESPPVEAPLPAPPAATASPAHHFGGVILLENDPALRSMLANELKAAGRAVFACADDAAARSLLQATPDRFELLILDQDARLEAGDRLAAAAARLCPGIKVCLLGGEQNAVTPAHLAPRLHRLNKPFGLPELRSTLSTILGSCPPPEHWT